MRDIPAYLYLWSSVNMSVHSTYTVKVQDRKLHLRTSDAGREALQTVCVPITGGADGSHQEHLVSMGIFQGVRPLLLVFQRGAADLQSADYRTGLLLSHVLQLRSQDAQMSPIASATSKKGSSGLLALLDRLLGLLPTVLGSINGSSHHVHGGGELQQEAVVLVAMLVGLRPLMDGTADGEHHGNWGPWSQMGFGVCNPL